MTKQLAAVLLIAVAAAFRSASYLSSEVEYSGQLQDK